MNWAEILASNKTGTIPQINTFITNRSQIKIMYQLRYILVYF